jgi:hypothetical protein
MVIETHGRDETTLRTAELIAEAIAAGKLGRFVHEVYERGSAWDVICRFEDGLLADGERDRWSGWVGGWRIVVGYADRLDEVPAYLRWGRVQAWLEHEDCAIAIEPGYGLHIYDREDFVESFNAEALAVAPFAEDSARMLNLGLPAA